ncbi:MAG TPA: cysteine desulfurase family protein [Bryobacteraceae bacterium]|nr:cysteine desulfurase family protein [Bryobacteraceae bacterium]
MRCYFDHNASTPPSPEALDAFVQAASHAIGNPTSIHADGQAARRIVEQARHDVAQLLGCQPKEIVFTSGGTESDNLALFGLESRHVIISAIEHPAVLESAAELERRGAKVTRVAVNSQGVVELESLGRVRASETGLVSIMHSNNETGAVQPIAEIAGIAHQSGAVMHSDGVQAAGKLPLDMAALGIDLYSITGHKFGALKGAGALFVREGVKLRRTQFGGRHERERRPGTENVAGIAALGAAARWLCEHGEDERQRLASLRDRLEQSVLARISGAMVNSADVPRTPNTSNIAFDGLDGEALVIALDLAGFSVATGAACSSGAVNPSHVLTAMGLSRDQAKSCLRFSMGRGNTAGQVDSLVDALAAVVARLRSIAPSHAQS